MAYNNYFPTNYPYYQPTYPQAAQQNHGSAINWCQGIEGAKSWPCAPGNSVLLLDSEGSCFYIKSSDASGMPLPLRIFDYTERTQSQQTIPTAQAPNYVTREEFEERLAQLVPEKTKKEK